MDPFAELERMALNAQPEANNEEPSEEEVTRWQRLFHYSRSEATDLIQEHRSNISRQRVSDEYWELVREEKEAQWYDREAYEHDLEISGRRKPR
jgi:hypothetical protein